MNNPDNVCNPNFDIPYMTIKQYYAGQAIIGLLYRNLIEDDRVLAQRAWKIAELMCEEGK